jgi:thioredoxin 1
MIINSEEIEDDRNKFKQFIEKNKDKKIILKFYADWCNPCKNINNTVNNMFNKIKDEKILVNINIDKLKNVKSYYKINAVPTIMTFINGERDNIIMSGDKLEIEEFFKNL